MRALLVITEDGYGKRIPVASIRKTGLKRIGVKVSSVPVAAAIAVNGTDADVVLASAGGHVEVIDLEDVPARDRRVGKGGRISKGVRVMTLTPGDRVAAVAVHVREHVVGASSAGTREVEKTNAPPGEDDALDVA